MPTQRYNIAGGLFAALIFLFVFGMFIGLPVIVWVFLIAAFIGLWVTTSKQRASERATEQPAPDRPWHKV